MKSNRESLIKENAQLVSENKKLKAFFNNIARLTSNHDVVDGYACVYASKLGAELEKVDFEWWKIT